MVYIVSDGVTAITSSTSQSILVPLDADTSTPTIGFGDGDTGFHEAGNGFLEFATGGSDRFEFSANHMGTTSSSGGGF